MKKRAKNGRVDAGRTHDSTRMIVKCMGNVIKYIWHSVHVLCVWIGYEWMSGWAAAARSMCIVYIVQVHALFANPKTHKIVGNGGAEVGECHIKTMKVNGHNSYAHHVLHIISAIYVRNVYASSAAFFASLFSLFFSIRFVCLNLSVRCL